MTELRSQSDDTLAAARRWLESTPGQILLAQEARIVEEIFDGIFGEQCLQLGVWGEPNVFLRYARTQRSACIADFPVSSEAVQSDVLGRLHRLPVASDSVDCVLLPHTLDYNEDRSHAILREVDRILRPHGHLVVLGFKPHGLWSLRRLLPGGGLPPAAHLISDRKLSDWLKLLDMRIHGITRYFFRWPLPGNKRPTSPLWEHRGQRFWPELAGCYMLTAQKRVFTLTPMKKPWRVRPKVVGGIAEPTTRVSRIRFNRNSFDRNN